MPKVEIHLEFSVPSDRLNVNQIVALFQEVKAQVVPALATCYLEATQDLVLGQTLGPKWADAAQVPLTAGFQATREPSSCATQNQFGAYTVQTPPSHLLPLR
jgi:hypothetical protein